MINQDTIDRIRESTDIISLIEKYFPLKRAGSNYKALCPFHNEKTPSFVISPEKQIFHCFGCSESGNVYTFLMKMDGLEFMEAVKKLADNSGIKLDFEKNANYQKQKDIKNRIIELNARAAHFYNRILLSNKGRAAREYLTQRGINPEMIEKFQLGFALEDNTLFKQAIKDGFSEELLIKAGLIGRNQSNNFFDMFRSRIIYPIYDELGKIRGFGGRVTDSSQSPKYLNTAQTDVFEKKKLMYGFYQGKEHIKNFKQLLILEGYMDVIAAHKHGITNAVATLGTALTPDHIYKIKHWVEEIVFIFDADEAGSKATERGIEIILGSDIRAKVCELPEGKDPEDIIRKNKNLFMKKVEESIPILNWRIEYSRKKFQHIDDKVDRNVRIVKDMASIINKLRDNESMGFVRSNEIMGVISEKLNISQKVILDEINESSKYHRNVCVSENIQKHDIGIKPKNKEEKLLKEILHVTIKYPQFISEVNEIIRSFKSGTKFYGILDMYLNKFNGDIHRMLENVDDEIKLAITRMSLDPINSNDNPRSYLMQVMSDFKRFQLKKRFEVLAVQINNLIKTNKSVNKNIKDEYDHLKKELKCTRKRI